MSLTPLTAGFLPLLDSVLLVVAREKGFAASEGLDLLLMRETSWANIRDRAALGHFDFAQMLAPMPIAATLGLNPLSAPMIAPMTLGLGGNGVTVSADLWARMADAGAPATFRPDVYRSALAPLGVPTPVADSKVEGLLAEPTEVAATGGTLVIGPDGFFDGQVFDPAALDAYIAGQRR